MPGGSCGCWPCWRSAVADPLRPLCDYRNAAMTISGIDIECRDGGCPHYGNCLPVYGARETPEHAIGKARGKGEYYHNLIVEGKI